MAFVKDDSGYTRGVGAIASMDAGSSRRRRAAALEGLRMARRDRVLALGAIRRDVETIAPPQRSTTTTRTQQTSTIETGQESAFSRPPPPVPPKIKLPFRPKGLDLVRADVRFPVKPTIKLPGTVIEPPKDGIKPTQSSGQPAPTPAPTKPSVTIVAAPGIGPISSGSAKPPAPSMDENAPPPWADEPPVDTTPAPAASSAKKPNYLLYAAIGIGAYLLLTRK